MKFDNNVPIYIQLVEQLKIYIISGKFSPGDRIPSVRELALQTRVNPNTMQKALTELEDLKLIYTERTNGKFVSNDTELIKKLKLNAIQSKIDEFVISMEQLGINKKDIIDILNKEIK